MASCPVARAKFRTWRGLTTTTGRSAVARAATTGSSSPPVASSTTRTGARVCSRATRCWMPVAWWGSAQRSFGHVQLRFGDVDADVGCFQFHPCLLRSTGPSLHDAGLGSPGNCSGSRWGGVRRPALPCGLPRPRGDRSAAPRPTQVKWFYPPRPRYKGSQHGDRPPHSLSIARGRVMRQSRATPGIIRAALARQGVRCVG